MCVLKQQNVSVRAIAKQMHHSLPARSLVSWSAAPNRLVALVFRPSNTALSAVAQANCTTTDTIRFGLLLVLLGDRVGRPRKWPTHGHACTPNQRDGRVPRTDLQRHLRHARSLVSFAKNCSTTTLRHTRNKRLPRR